MSPTRLSVNNKAWSLAEKLRDEAATFNVDVKKASSGVTLIDSGIKANGSLLAGKLLTEICLGGYGQATIFSKAYDDLELPTIFVHTSHPAMATLGSQYAGWRIKTGKYIAMGSGPARALALKPRELYEKIDYNDEANVAVLLLETSKEPPEEVLDEICHQCQVEPDRLLLILAPTASLAGSTQISGRVVETGIHKFTQLGFDPKLVTQAWGYAPIAPTHPKTTEAMGRTNDAILYAGVTSFIVNYDDEEKLRDFVDKTPSSASPSYGKPFLKIFREANYDFYKIDPNLFAPAVLIVTNARTGNTFRAGKVNVEVFRQSIGF